MRYFHCRSFIQICLDSLGLVNGWFGGRMLAIATENMYHVFTLCAIWCQKPPPPEWAVGQGEYLADYDFHVEKHDVSTPQRSTALSLPNCAQMVAGCLGSQKQAAHNFPSTFPFVYVSMAVLNKQSFPLRENSKLSGSHVHGMMKVHIAIKYATGTNIPAVCLICNILSI